MAMVTMHDDMFTDDVIADPYTYYGHLYLGATLARR